MTPISWERGVWLARTRALVTLPDGRTAKVLSWPIPAEWRTSPARRNGTKAKVELPTGAVISVDPATVIEVATSHPVAGSRRG